MTVNTIVNETYENNTIIRGSVNYKKFENLIHSDN